MRITASWPIFTLHNLQVFWLAVRAWLVLALIRALVLPLPAAAAQPTGVLVAQVPATHVVSSDGRLLPDRPDGATLATVQGSALVNPAMPVTVRGSRFASRRSPAPIGARFRTLATGYSSTADQTDSSPFITASGTHVHDGTVATNFLPFGTRVRFLNYRPDTIFVVEDRHHPRLSDRVDIWFTSRSAAIQFGARVLQIEVVE